MSRIFMGQMCTDVCELKLIIYILYNFNDVFWVCLFYYREEKRKRNVKSQKLINKYKSKVIVPQ